MEIGHHKSGSICDMVGSRETLDKIIETVVSPKDSGIEYLRNYNKRSDPSLKKKLSKDSDSDGVYRSMSLPKLVKKDLSI